MFFLPDWWVTLGLAPSGIRASAAGTASFSTFAPRLPPTTRMFRGPLRLVKRWPGAGISRISLRTGLPVTTALPSALPKSAGKPNSTRWAIGVRVLLDSSSAASAFTSASGTPRERAIIPPGTVT